MKDLGAILIFIGIIGLVYFQAVFDTSVEVNYDKLNVGKKIEGFPERVNNLGLMQDRQNYTIISLGLIIVGVVLYLKGRKGKEEEETEKEENERENKYEEEEIKREYYCQHCGALEELDDEEIKTKIFKCENCQKDNKIL